MIRLRRSHFLDSDPEPATVALRRSRQFILGLLLGVNILVLPFSGSEPLLLMTPGSSRRKKSKRHISIRKIMVNGYAIRYRRETVCSARTKSRRSTAERNFSSPAVSLWRPPAI